MSVKVNVTVNFDSNLDEAARIAEELVNSAVLSAAQSVRDKAKSLCPVDTGRLRDSIEADADGCRAEISANTDYASYVEFGTSKSAPQPYLVPALIEGGDEAVEIMAEIISGGL
jgi:HK97 gp10 family phage protein